LAATSNESVRNADGPARCLAGSALFSGLPPAELAELAAVARTRRFKPGGKLFSEGDRTDSILTIVHGAVRLFRTSKKGQMLGLRTLSVGSVLGQMSALDDGRHSVSAIAEDSVEVLSVPRLRYVQALKRHPEAALALARILADVVRRLSDELEAMKFASAEARLLFRLFERATGRREIWVTHATLAIEVGATRENVSRLLGKLEKQRIIKLWRGRIEVLDHRALEKLRSRASGD
jgi:CRP-like cAMP-binding protein